MSAPNSNSTNNLRDAQSSSTPRLGDLNFQGPQHPTTHENNSSNANAGPEGPRPVNGTKDILPNNERLRPAANRAIDQSVIARLYKIALQQVMENDAQAAPVQPAPLATPLNPPAITGETLNPATLVTEPPMSTPRPSDSFHRSALQAPTSNPARMSRGITQTIANRRLQMPRSEMQRRRDVANIVGNAVKEYIENEGLLEGVWNDDDDDDDDVVVDVDRVIDVDEIMAMGGNLDQNANANIQEKQKGKQKEAFDEDVLFLYERKMIR
ncbi:hypothetical protein BZA77DRAFT_295815 [Pyronema omphalodes]|nr:hypothetical protein BZA77DRAFT_295815 [Pyronema omphalodes]